MGEEAEEAATASSVTPDRAPSSAARSIADVPLAEAERVATGIGELDRVLGGGLVPGMVALLGGAPGIGKSTLLLAAADRVARTGRTALYVSGEESATQVRLRAERLGATSPSLLVAPGDVLDDVTSLVGEHAPDMLVVDSVQTLSDPELGSSPGSIVQVRECAAALVRLAKRDGVATVLVGHLTKDGSIAGPRTLEHLVDTVLEFEGDRHHALRLVRTVKNRFGPAGEVGCFEMAGEGLREVTDPSSLFLADRATATPGVTVTVTVEGPRPLAVEVQSLVADSDIATPRRQSTGLDASRVSILVAVLDKRAGVSLAGQDLFASAAGGIRVREPAADLALCLAIASAARDVPVPQGLVSLGEVGLAGEVRTVPQVERRLAEAARLGFESALVPGGYRGASGGLALTHVSSIAEALDVALGSPQRIAAV